MQRSKVISTIPAPGVDVQEIEIGPGLCQQPGDGSAREQAVPASASSVPPTSLRICHQTLPLQRHELGHGSFHPKAHGCFRGRRLHLCPRYQKARTAPSDIRPMSSRKKATEIGLYIHDMTENEREIVKAGCLINLTVTGKCLRDKVGSGPEDSMGTGIDAYHTSGRRFLTLPEVFFLFTAQYPLTSSRGIRVPKGKPASSGVRFHRRYDPAMK